MADINRIGEGPPVEKKPTEKRPATQDEDSEDPPAKKITMSLKTPKPEMKMSFGLAKKPATGIKMSLNAQKPKETTVNLNIVRKTGTVAKVFNSDSESDEEEMPPEAKMRMKNVGRDTPTAAGPNSFGKGKLGFSNHHRVLEREIAKQLEKEGD